MIFFFVYYIPKFETKISISVYPLDSVATANGSVKRWFCNTFVIRIEDDMVILCC